MILLNDFQRQWQDIEQDATKAFVQIGRSGWYILGEEVSAFETNLAKTWGLDHAVGVASGLDALELALRSLGCKPGTKVLTTPISAFATTLAILKLGAIPVFVDTDARGLIDLRRARLAFEHDPSLRFFVPVHLFGHSLDLDELAALQSEFGLTIVEDCAQSIGAMWKGRNTGTVGAMAATSFYPTKNLGAMGDGGAVLTREGSRAAAVRSLRDYGQSAKYKHDVIGYNSRLDELQAALLRQVALPRLQGWITRRREISSAYLSGIRNTQVRGSEVFGESNLANSSWHLFPVLVASDVKRDFMAHLKANGVSTGEHYPIAIPDQNAMKDVRFEIAADGIPTARSFCQSAVSLPIHPYLTDSEVSTVVRAVNAWSPGSTAGL